MSGSPLIQQWISEFCAPVVVTLATPEVERICLQNGLLFHELLSCFGHLDGINSSIRVGVQSVPMPDAHIRFERVTEVKSKTTDQVEDLLKTTFSPFDINRLPGTVAELKNSPPSAWTNSTEQIVARSLSFSEYEMVSHPIVLLSVVATSEVDPLASMQELISIHHTPTCFSNGQYDSTIQRVFLVLEDAAEKSKDAYSVLRNLAAYFPAASTKLISINSFSAATPNLQQPDMWSRFLIPKYFPQHAPQLQGNASALIPGTQNPVLGARLSVEDFMKLREFCIWLFNEQIVPGLERRITFLSRQVNDARKGMKNVWKSFFRKPRDESDNVHGGVKYRFDKIESQTLVLADLSFMIRDYDTASSLYKTLRDDFRSDKSIIHLAHVHLMLALCQLRTEPHKYKDVFTNLEAISQCMASGMEVLHSQSYFALLAAELYVATPSGRSPLDSAKILLQASGNLSRFSVLSSLLIERASLFFLQANQVRKYVLHTVLTGNKLYKCGPVAAKHASVCFAAALMLLERSQWSDPQAKLSKALSQDLKAGGRDNAQRSLVFLLKMLKAILDDPGEGNGSLLDAVNVLNELSRGGPWGHVHVGTGWEMCSARDILLGGVPVASLDEASVTSGPSRAEIEGLAVPEIDVQSVEILEPINGPNLNDAPKILLADEHDKDLLFCLLEVERAFMNRPPPAADDLTALTLEELWIKAEKSFFERLQMKQLDPTHSKIRVPLGENVIVKVRFTNKLPVDLRMTALQLLMDSPNSFVVEPQQISIGSEVSEEIVLKAKPQSLGHFSLRSVRWQLGEHLVVSQPLWKKGVLLQKSLNQRANRERGKDTSLQFEVVDSQPLLQMQFEGLSREVLQGQLLKSTLKIINKGAAVATEIFIKMSQPSFVFYLQSSDNEGQVLDFYGMSSTVVYLRGLDIAPGQEIKLDAWLRVTKPGLQRISLLLAYQSPSSLEAALATVASPLPSPSTSSKYSSHIRTSYLCVETRGLPSLGVALKMVHKPSSANVCTLVTEISNYLKGSSFVSEDDCRSSTVGQLDLNLQDTEFVDVDSNCLKVVGVWMIGAGQPLNSTRSSSQTHVYACPSERVVQCFAVQMQGAKSGVAQHNWVIPLPERSNEAFAASSHLHLAKIVESFLCLWYADQEFSRRVREARITVQMAEDEANAAGPRSIADVRRERQRQLELRAENNPTEDWDTVFDDAELAAVSVPKSIADVSRLELRKNSVNVAMVWVCRWADKIRWGIHHSPHVGLHHTESNALSNIHISVQHDRELSWSANRATIESPIVVPIRVTVRSLSYETVRVSVRAQSQRRANSGSGANEVSVVHQLQNIGYAWVGKVAYEDIILPAQQDVELEFLATVFCPGVFDLNKFSVAACYVKRHDDVVAAEHFPLQGQSLLQVHE